MANRVLVCWIGNTDLRALARSLPKKDSDVVIAVSGGQPLPAEEGEGPIRSLVANQKFDEIHLLTNFDEKVSQKFAKWLSGKVKVHQVKLTDPSNYTQVLKAVRPILASLYKKGVQLAFHLSPGTPAMAGIWILLGKSLYPATLYQSYRGNVNEAVIPFDISVEVLPEFLKEPARFWQHLLDNDPAQLQGFEQIVGSSEALRSVVGRAQRAAIHDVPVLILGESGTGKEMFAEAIHRASHRRDRPFEMVNCAAIPSNLLESELFGHVKGAFTDASKDRKGLFELADGGTLFLDEIGECSLEMQAKLLRVLQPPSGKGSCHRVFRKVGDSRDSESDVRVIAATNRDLVKRAKAGEFREDLIYRLATITIKLPPLRERGSDCEHLAEVLLEGLNDQFQRQHGNNYERKKLSEDAKKFICRQAWPGNIRQLRGALIQASVMSQNAELSSEDIAAAIADFPGIDSAGNFDPPLGNGFSIEEYLNLIRGRFIRRALEESGGVKEKAASLLGLNNRQILTNHMKQCGIDSTNDDGQ